MNYKRLQQDLWKYGRDSTFAYVSDGYKNHLRQDKKYQQWSRLCHKVALKVMSLPERKALDNILFIRVICKNTLCMEEK